MSVGESPELARDATALVSYRQSSTASTAIQCPRKGSLLMFHLTTGLVVPASCGSLECPFCLVREARRYAAAIALARPTRAMILTNVGNDWKTARRRVNRCHEILGRTGHAGKICYQIEPSPGKDEHHAHVWQWGGRAGLTPDILQAAASRAGIGYASIEPLRLTGVWQGGRSIVPLSYGLKIPLSQPQGDRQLCDEVVLYLLINGSRLSHASRGFWRDTRGSAITRDRGGQKGRVGVRWQLAPAVD